MSFGDVAAGAVVTSSDTFTVRHDRRYPFSADALGWSIAFDPAAFKISGYVTTAEGVTITAYGPQTKSTVTDAAGVFSLEGLPPGQYTVSPTQPGSVFTPIRQDVTLINQDITGLVFIPRVPEDALSNEVIERIVATPSIFIPEDQVILPNGISLRDYLLMRGITITPDNSAIAPASTHQSIQLGRVTPKKSTLPPAADPQQKKNDVIAAMLAQARLYACGKAGCTTWDHDAEKDEQGNDLPNKPAQKGLTYVYGGKNHTVRTLPTDNCTEMTYGLDCSGFIHHVAKSVGIDLIKGGVSQQRPPGAWAIPSEWQLEMKSIPVTDGSNIETGDILVWPAHIGIAQSSNNFISSAGGPNWCKTNIDGTSGPRSDAIKNFSGPYPTSILRLTPTTPPPPPPPPQAKCGSGSGLCPVDYYCWGDYEVWGTTDHPVCCTGYDPANDRPAACACPSGYVGYGGYCWNTNGWYPQ